MNYKVSERRIRNNRLRRQRQLRHHILMCFTTLLLISAFSLTLFGFNSKAQSSLAEISYKYYRSVTVKSGDTLWDYARLYAEDEFYTSYDKYIDEVIHINTLSDENITAGQHIILPYYSNEFVE